MSKPNKKLCLVCQIRRKGCNRQDCPTYLKQGIVKPEKMDVRK